MPGVTAADPDAEDGGEAGMAMPVGIGALDAAVAWPCSCCGCANGAAQTREMREAMAEANFILEKVGKEVVGQVFVQF